jgi:L-ascorbate metabolism protein UlaG (beta-lactamase superfamily)
MAIAMIEYESLKFRWLGHDGFIISNEAGTSVAIDPFQLEGKFDPVDVLISTHEHFDHCHPDSMEKLVSPNTEVIGIPMAKETLEKLNCKQIHYVAPGKTLTIGNLNFEFVASYNVNKYRDPDKGIHFHPKADNKVGVVMEMDGHRVYHAGDSDHIPEMADIKTDVALLPVSGTYVMTAVEAIEAAKTLNPKLAIPMHFGTIVGDRSMAEEFANSVSCAVEIPDKE